MSFVNAERDDDDDNTMILENTFPVLIPAYSSDFHIFIRAIIIKKKKKKIENSHIHTGTLTKLYIRQSISIKT